MTDLAYLSALDVASAIRGKRLSSSEYMAQQLARITAQDKALHSVVTLASDSAMAEASVADERVRKGLPLGPLHGVPFALKDIIDAQGLHTTAHSKILADNLSLIHI